MIYEFGMPRNYTCRKCGKPHSPPTGKHCRQARIIELDEEPQELANTMPFLREMKRDFIQKIDGIDKRVEDIEGARGNSTNDDAEVASQHSDEQDTDGEGDAASDITPSTIRQKTSVMRKAANRLTEIRWQDDDGEVLTDNTRSKNGGKKSGSMLVATETVRERIDWPHLYLTRMTDGRRKGVAYAELTESEFVFGFMTMILSPRCCWDNLTMQRVLRTVMQHSVEFSWENARLMYEEMGLEVERENTEWSDTDKLRELRFSHSRLRTSERKETSDTTRPPLKTAPVGTKACVGYQTRACDQTRDHAPYTHACAYCLKMCNAICRHTEADCIRRVTDSAKNSKKRE